MVTIQNIILTAAATATGLMAGLFFSFSYSVTAGLHTLPDAEYISAMQSINRAIQNPMFFLVFFSALLLLPLSAYLNYGHPAPHLRFWILIIAVAIYLTGVFGVTAAGNIPLNNLLEKFDLQHSSREMIASQRLAFESRWNSLNMVRTISSSVTFILVLIACLTNVKSR